MLPTGGMLVVTAVSAVLALTGCDSDAAPRTGAPVTATSPASDDLTPLNSDQEADELLAFLVAVRTLYERFQQDNYRTSSFAARIKNLNAFRIGLRAVEQPAELGQALRKVQAAADRLHAASQNLRSAGDPSSARFARAERDVIRRDEALTAAVQDVVDRVKLLIGEFAQTRSSQP